MRNVADLIDIRPTVVIPGLSPVLRVEHEPHALDSMPVDGVFAPSTRVRTVRIDGVHAIDYI